MISDKFPSVLPKPAMHLIRLLSLLLISFFLISKVGAHGGGIDENGDHNNRTSDNYQPHERLLTERSYGSKLEAIYALDHVKYNAWEPNSSGGSNSPEITQLDAETILGIRIAPEVRNTPLDRQDYAYSQNIELSIIARLGGIFSPYTLRFFADRGETDIEHIVAVSEAHESGLSSRSDSERKAFAQDSQQSDPGGTPPEPSPKSWE